MGKRLDGREIAAEIRAEMQVDIERLKKEHDLVPGLAVVLVGADNGEMPTRPALAQHASPSCTGRAALGTGGR